MATSSGKYVGIDISKDRLDVAVLGDRQEKQVDNTQAGIEKLVHWMQALQPELIVVEATGGYQRAVVEALFWAGLAVAVVNPARVRQFACADGLLAKTDKLDAFVLAKFGKKMQPKRYEGKSEAEKQFGVTPFQWTHGGLGNVGYEHEGLRTGWVRDSRGLSVAGADCTSLR